MSDQQSQQDDNPEPQQHDGQVAMDDQQHDGQVATLTRPQTLLLIQITGIIIQLTCKLVIDQLAPLYLRTPYHTSALSGAGWVHELLTGHPERIQNELGVSRSTFTLLVKSMLALDINSSRNVSIEEQVSIFLYTAVTGLSCTHVGERFQRSSSTISK
jgi:hypothetical protein